MKGWKTWTSAGIVAFCAVGTYFGWLKPEDQRLIMEIAAALGIIGIGHKVDRLRMGE